jgi:hypothetical protein
MPCMCGDLYCGSCGPAQGNHRCMACNRWDEDGGCERPEECERQIRAAIAHEEEMYASEEPE